MYSSSVTQLLCTNLYTGGYVSPRDPSSAGYGIQIHLLEYEPSVVFKHTGITLSFSVEPIKDFISKVLNLGALIDEPDLDYAHHACVFDRIVDGHVRLSDPASTR